MRPTFNWGNDSIRPGDRTVPSPGSCVVRSSSIGWFLVVHVALSFSRLFHLLPSPFPFDTGPARRRPTHATEATTTARSVPGAAVEFLARSLPRRRVPCMDRPAGRRLVPRPRRPCAERFGGCCRLVPRHRRLSVDVPQPAHSP